MDELARKRAIEIILDELAKTKEEEPKMDEMPEIEIEMPSKELPRTDRLKEAFKKVGKY